MNYIPINIKTNYDLLNSIIKIDDLIKFALKNNIECLGITDPHMFSCMEFYQACKKNNIKPIIGTVINYNDLLITLYAKNFDGYQNLCRLVSINNSLTLTKEDLISNKENIILVLSYDNYNLYEELSLVFDNLYLSYKNSNELTNALLITKNIVYSNELRMFEKNDEIYLKYAYMIKDGKTIKDDVSYDISDCYFIKDVDKIHAQTTFDFASLFDFKIPEIKFELPKINAEDSVTLIRNLCVKGLNKRLNNNVTKEYAERLKYELSVIENMKYVDYFLIVYDFILYAKKNNILVGPGRGSAVASLACYSLGITDIDPLKYNLIFERFLNPARISLPDIDLDFEDTKRDEVIDYVKEKYGKKHVLNIISFDTLLPKAVIRDVGRVIGTESYLIDKVCKTIKDEKSFKDLQNNSLFLSVINSDSDYNVLINICKKLDGIKRHTSIHAAGVVISKNKIADLCPVYKSGDIYLTSYSKEYLEDLGLIKMDFLAITNLTIIKNVLNLIKENININISLNDIPLDDKETLKHFGSADTIGVFQFESSGMRNVLKKMNADSFDDLIAVIALFRPGPRDEIDSYIKRKQGKEKITYIFKELESVLKSTYGIIVYQEQVLEILKVIGNYTYSEADNVRKAISKKNESLIMKEKDIFIKKACEQGFDEKNVRLLFDKILKFSQYGFNKSHSVAYSIVGYWMQYLKIHYKEYYMMNLLNSVIGSEEKTKLYLDESKILKIKFKMPDINASSLFYQVKNNEIIFPLTSIKNIGKENVKKIIEDKYDDYFDFVRKLTLKGINKNIMVSLINAGALESFKLTKKTMIENLENALNYAVLCKDLDESLVLKPSIINQTEYNKEELMEMEYETFGFYYSTHPVTKYRREGMVTLNNIESYFDKNVTLIVLVESVKTIITKNKDKMAFIVVSDDYTKKEMVMFPREYEKYFDIKKGDVIKLTAHIEKRMSEYQLVTKTVEYLK